MTITADFSGAWAKTAMLKSIPKAALKQLTTWAAATIKDLKISARDKLKKTASFPGRKSGHLYRNIGMETELKTSSWSVAVGTGVGGKANVKYAWIQDKGGMTHPMVTARMKRWAWWMHYKAFGREVRGLGLRGMERKGALRTWGNMSVYKAIALTKTGTKLNVRIPESRWFTDVIERRKTFLGPMMDAGTILRIAAVTATVSGPEWEAGGD